jgi:hypothetical protein
MGLQISGVLTRRRSRLLGFIVGIASVVVYFDPNSSMDPQLFEPRMPEVDIPMNLEEIFQKARQAAAGGSPPTGSKGRHVAVVTPGRMVMMHPCAEPGTMSAPVVESVEKLLPSQSKKNVAVIAYTELEALRADLKKSIPFFGLLTGMAYIGHAVWVFEGHSSALAAGCREADLLIIDELMISFLASDWLRTISKVMRTPLVYRHERATFSLHKISPENRIPNP